LSGNYSAGKKCFFTKVTDYKPSDHSFWKKFILAWIIHTALRSPAKQKKTKKNKKKQFNIGFIWFCLVLWGFA